MGARYIYISMCILPDDGFFFFYYCLFPLIHVPLPAVLLLFSTASVSSLLGVCCYGQTARLLVPCAAGLLNSQSRSQTHRAKAG